MHAASRLATAGAAGGAASAGDDESEAVIRAAELVKAQAGQVRDEVGEAHERAPSRPCSQRHDSPTFYPIPSMLAASKVTMSHLTTGAYIPHALKAIEHPHRRQHMG